MDPNLERRCGSAAANTIGVDACSVDSTKDADPPRSATLRPGSLTLMESLEKKRNESAKSPVRWSTLPRSDGVEASTMTTTRPLTKALQPKGARHSAYSVLPSAPYKIPAAPTHLTTGVGVSDSVLSQQQRNSASGFHSLSVDTAAPTSTLVPIRPEIVSGRTETGKSRSVESRGVVQEPNPGLAMLRSLQKRQSTPREPKPEPETLDNLRKSMTSFPVVRTATVQRPDSRPKSIGYTPSPSKNSKVNTFAFDADEHSSTGIAEPNANSVSNAVFDPSPTISKMLGEQRSITVRSGNRSKPRLESQSAFDEPIFDAPRPLIRIQKAPAPETASEDDGRSSVLSDPFGSPSLCNSPSELQETDPKFDDQERDATRSGGGDSEQLEPDSLKVPEHSAEETGKNAANDVGKVQASGEPAGWMDAEPEDAPPPLPAIPPPRLFLRFDNPEKDADDDGQFFTTGNSSVTVPDHSRCFHRPTDSNLTVDSGLECLTPHDSSADEQEDQLCQEVGPAWSSAPTSPRSRVVSSVGSRSITPASTTDSEPEENRVNHSTHKSGSGLPRPTSKPVDVCSTQDSITSTGANPPLLDRLLTENGTSLEHFQSENLSPVSGVFPAHLSRANYSTETEESVLLLVIPEVTQSDESPTETTELYSSANSLRIADDGNTDDVITTCVSDCGVVRECVVQLVKGPLGLGFCIEGGKNSAAGDRPITVKRLFRADPSLLGELRVGDEIRSVNGEDFTELSHYQAWNRLKAMPDGTLRVTVNRR